MIYRNAWALALPVSRILGVLAKTVAVTAALAVVPASLAFAQAKKPPAKKPAVEQPQQPPHPQGAPQEQRQVQFIYSPWTKVCKNDASTDNKALCRTSTAARLDSGMVVGVLTIIDVTGTPQGMELIVPIGVHLPPGTRLVLDDGKESGQVLTAPIQFCGPDKPLCVALFQLSAEELDKIKKSKQVTIQYFPLGSGDAWSIPLPMATFAKAHDGPPTDETELAARQKKLQEELQKAAEKARKQLEAQHPTPTPGKTQ